MLPLRFVSLTKVDILRQWGWALLAFALAFDPPPVFSQPANVYSFNPGVKVTDAVPLDGTSSIFLSSGHHYTAFRGDTVYVVWWESRLSYPPTGNHVFLAKSTDAGLTFGPSIRVEDLPAGFNPSMRVDTNGVIYVAYQRQSKIYFTKSTDGGATFSPSVSVVDSLGDSFPQGYPGIAVNNRRNVFVGWRDGRTGLSTIFIAASYDSGRTFGKNVQVGHGYNAVTSGFDITAGEDGRVYVAYEDTMQGQYGIVVARSTDSGQSFPAFALVLGQLPVYVSQPSLAVSSSNQIGVLYEQGVAYDQNSIRFSVSSDLGQSFSTSVRVDTGYTELICSTGGRQSLCTSNGLFFAAWCGARMRPSDSDCISNVFLSYSPDGGHSFVTEVGADTSGRSFANPWSPSVAVNQNGKAFVAWVDDRLDPFFQIDDYVFGASAAPHFVKGDLNLDGILTPTDVVMELNAVFLAKPFPASFATADVNCDLALTPADVVLQLNAVFMTGVFPC